MADVQMDKGLETTETFQKQYGVESVTFVKCDVTSETER